MLNQTAQIEADFLMRIRSNRCLYSAPEPYTGKGRPKKHGQKFKLNDSSTWWFALLLPQIGTPAVSPKPRGKSPGWPVGNKRTKKTRYPVVKKGQTSHKKRTRKFA